MKSTLILSLLILFATQWSQALPYTCDYAMRGGPYPVDVYDCKSNYRNQATFLYDSIFICFDNAPFTSVGEVLKVGVGSDGTSACLNPECLRIHVIKDATDQVTMVRATTQSENADGWLYESCRKRVTSNLNVEK